MQREDTTAVPEVQPSGTNLERQALAAEARVARALRNREEHIAGQVGAERARTVIEAAIERWRRGDA